MNNEVNELFECREKVKSILLTYKIDPNEQVDLVTDLTILVMNWSQFKD